MSVSRHWKRHRGDFGTFWLLESGDLSLEVCLHSRKVCEKPGWYWSRSFSMEYNGPFSTVDEAKAAAEQSIIERVNELLVLLGKEDKCVC